MHANPGGAEGGDEGESLAGVGTAATAWRDGSYCTSASFCTRAGQNMCPNFSRIRTVRGTVADWKVEVDVHAYVSIAFFAPS